MNDTIIIGIDLAKNVFQLHGMRADGSVVLIESLRHSLFSHSPTYDAKHARLVKATLPSKSALGVGTGALVERSAPVRGNRCGIA